MEHLNLKLGIDVGGGVEFKTGMVLLDILTKL